MTDDRLTAVRALVASPRIVAHGEYAKASLAVLLEIHDLLAEGVAPRLAADPTTTLEPPQAPRSTTRRR